MHHPLWTLTPLFGLCRGLFTSVPVDLCGGSRPKAPSASVLLGFATAVLYPAHSTPESGRYPAAIAVRQSHRPRNPGVHHRDRPDTLASRRQAPARQRPALSVKVLAAINANT